MTDKTPERIWAWGKQTKTRVSAITTEFGVDRLWSAHGLPQIMNEIGAKEYVRADIHAAVVAERDELENQLDSETHTKECRERRIKELVAEREQLKAKLIELENNTWTP